MTAPLDEAGIRARLEEYGSNTAKFTSPTWEEVEWLLAANATVREELASAKIVMAGQDKLYQLVIAERDALKKYYNEEWDRAKTAEIKCGTLSRQRDRLVEALEGAKISHLVVDGDCWFSCPKAKSDWHEGSACCDESVDRTKCRCGADEHNAKIDAALKPGGDVAVEIASKIHACCGCCCHVCADGHGTGAQPHTQVCLERMGQA